MVEGRVNPGITGGELKGCPLGAGGTLVTEGTPEVTGTEGEGRTMGWVTGTVGLGVGVGVVDAVDEVVGTEVPDAASWVVVVVVLVAKATFLVRSFCPTRQFLLVCVRLLHTRQIRVMPGMSMNTSRPWMVSISGGAGTVCGRTAASTVTC